MATNYRLSSEIWLQTSDYTVLSRVYLPRRTITYNQDSTLWDTHPSNDAIILTIKKELDPFRGNGN
ncbi:MAG: hypothetical protein ACQZ3N_08320 [cyanobacterium endosymbiont of Rhopalodia yunnanensis]